MQSVNAQEKLFKKLREKMVAEQVLLRGVKDERILNAMKRIPRHLFVPKEIKLMAYEDHPLSIGYGQTISQPYIVALMLEALAVGKDSKILEIGTGSGYQTAILSILVDEVMTVEIQKELAVKAKQRLIELGCKNIRFKVGDGKMGWREKAPFNGIIVSAAPEKIPPALSRQLKLSGRMIIPVGDANKGQELISITRKENGYAPKSLLSVRFVPLV